MNKIYKKNHKLDMNKYNIEDLIPHRDKMKLIDKIIDVTGKTVLPGLVECHTHTAFAGSRADEFRQKL